MTTFSIHYQSPAGDPLKVPRPHHITVADDGAHVRGGEIGLTGLFLGFARDTSPQFVGGRWSNAADVLDMLTAGETFTGWYACFGGFGDPFTNATKVSRVEVTTGVQADLAAFTPPAVRWSVQPNDGTSTPLRLHADMGSTGMAIPVTEADLDALVAVLADRVVNADPEHPALEFLGAVARYHIGDASWANLLLEHLALAPEDRSARLEEDGIEP